MKFVYVCINYTFENVSIITDATTSFNNFPTTEKIGRLDNGDNDRQTMASKGGVYRPLIRSALFMLSFIVNCPHLQGI